MILNTKGKKAINKYFRDFVIANKDHYYDEPEKSTFKKIQKHENIPFHKSWEYMMFLIQLIEKKYNFKNIETHDNYVRFSTKEFEGFQDKGWTKLSAFYTCCFKILEILWKDQKPPFNYDSHEPFDEIDLK